MPAGLPIACTGDLVDPKFGPPNVIASVTTSVLAGGRPVATLFAIVAPHGNYSNPKAPGYNPECALTELSMEPFSHSVLVEGFPVAVAGGPGVGTMCGCTFHSVAGPGCPTVLVGIV
jgi:uncharacterized Zn-binding protein involved in type VI secretion